MNAMILPGLARKSVLITGGSTGIGREIVRAFARQKAKVTFLDIDEAGAQHTAELVATDGGTAPNFLKCDLTDTDALKLAITQATRTQGEIEVLVNNAANDDRHAWEAVDRPYWDGRLAVNLSHVFFATQSVLPAMKDAGGGVILNMASVTPLLGLGGMPAYSAAKAAIIGLTRSTAKEFGSSNIRVNAIVPGAIFTERQIKLWYTEEVQAEIKAAQCLKTFVMPEDVANMVVFLASDAAKMCTAQTYVVDAGWL
jgi:D-xylose 1-dehydrogenase